MLERTVSKPPLVSGITAAAVLRLIEQRASCILLDEIDTMIKGDAELREVLGELINSGFERACARFIKNVPTPGGYEAQEFSAHTPAQPRPHQAHRRHLSLLFGPDRPLRSSRLLPADRAYRYPRSRMRKLLMSCQTRIATSQPPSSSTHSTAPIAGGLPILEKPASDPLRPREEIPSRERQTQKPAQHYNRRHRLGY